MTKSDIAERTGRLIKHEGQLSLLPTLSDTEQRLLKTFRALPASKQKRVVDDCEEFATAMGQGVAGN